MQQVFISSIQRDYGEVREAVRGAVESLGMQALMAELAGANVASPQRALLDLVARCDVFLLLIGPSYSAPTEDEFNEANRLGKPILVLKQNVEFEPEQQAFLERVAGGWSGGRLWGTFDDAADVALAVVRALTNAATAGDRERLVPTAQARATELAGDTRGGSQNGSVARVAFAPLVPAPLLDAVALDQPDLGDSIAGLVRTHRLVDQSVGIKSAVTREGVAIAEVGSFANAPPIVIIGADGAVMCEFSVAGDDQFGGSRVDPTRLRSGIAAAGAFALDVWSRIDPREEVQQVGVALVIPDAQHKVFGAPTHKNSMSMVWGMPQNVAVPDPPLVVRRAEVAGDELARRLIAEVKRAFADSNAVES